VKKIFKENCSFYKDTNNHSLTRLLLFCNVYLSRR